MFVAKQKRKENIAEYLLYMWNVEDLIRANGLDMKQIEQNVICRYGLTDPQALSEMTEWWDNLRSMMVREHKETKGHIQILQSLSNDIYNYHLYLLTQQSEIPYQNIFQTAWPDISALMTKIPGGDQMQHVDICLTAVYDYYLLKLQKKTVLADTANAVRRISHLLSTLSQKYLDAEKKLHPDDEPDTNIDGTLKGLAQ